MKNFKFYFVMLVFLTASVINAQSSKNSVKKSKIAKTTFTVKGMTCQGCVNTVEKVIKNINGVSKSDVSLKNGEAVVEYDPNKTDSKSIENKFKKLPYTVTEKKTGSAKKGD